MENKAIQSHPYISVITINFNDCIGLERTIRSVISQTYSDFEYIIIDGGSNDGSKDVIGKYKKYFSYWVSEPDNGIYHAMNKGVKQAKGEYCIFMNSGDLLCNPQTLELASIEIKATNADYCTGTLLLNRNNNIAGVIFPPADGKLLLLKRSLAHQATFTKRCWLEKIPYFENTKIVGDWQQITSSISIHGATYHPIKCPIAIFDLSGISTINDELRIYEANKFRESFVPSWLLKELDAIISPNVHSFTIEKKKHPILFTIIKYIKKLRTQPAKYWYKIIYNNSLKKSLSRCELK